MTHLRRLPISALLLLLIGSLLLSACGANSNCTRTATFNYNHQSYSVPVTQEAPGGNLWSGVVSGVDGSDWGGWNGPALIQIDAKTGEAKFVSQDYFNSYQPEGFTATLSAQSC